MEAVRTLQVHSRLMPSCTLGSNPALPPKKYFTPLATPKFIRKKRALGTWLRKTLHRKDFCFSLTERK